MIPAEFYDSDTFRLVIMPLLIFLARIMDVSIGTVRIIVVSRGNRMVAPILGFFEVLIWVVVISNIIQQLNSAVAYIAYAGGFAAGNYVGLWIEAKLAIGINLVSIITSSTADDLMNTLHEKGFGATVVNAKGRDNDVNIIYTIVKRKEVTSVVNMIKKLYPDAFYTIEDIRYISNESYTGNADPLLTRPNILKRWRLGK